MRSTSISASQSFSENQVQRWADNSKSWWAVGALLTTVSKRSDLKGHAASLYQPVYNEIVVSYQRFRGFLEGDRRFTREDFEQFVVIWNAIDGGAKARSVEKWQPVIVRSLAATMFATYHGNRQFFMQQTLPFLDQWFVDFRDDDIWKWLGVPF